MLSTSTRLYCSLAKPGADLTGLLYNRIIELSGVDAVYLPTTCSDLEKGFAGIEALAFAGATVSMPYKQQVLGYVHQLDEKAKAIGAVNTLVRGTNGFTGYNTDWYGAIASLNEHISMSEKRVLLLGAGGAARAIGYGLINAGAQVTISNRTDAAASRLASHLKARVVPLSAIADDGTFDIIVNSTSVGFMGRDADLLLLPESTIERAKCVMDAVFVPHKTKLLDVAERKGIRGIAGTRMLVHQAILQFKLWGFVGVDQPDKIERDLIAYLCALPSL
jgi:shikimate dehydrogenase